MNFANSDLMACKNLGAATVNILHAIGISSLDELHAVGAVEAYNRIRERGIKVSKVMLYALQGALENQHWTELSSEAKQRLVSDAESLCA